MIFYRIRLLTSSFADNDLFDCLALITMGVLEVPAQNRRN